MTTVTAKLDQAFQFITKFAWLNALWIGFTILGLGVAGFFPATVALFVTVRRWITTDNEGSTLRPFSAVYKANFLRANLYGWLLLAFGAVLYLNYHIIQQAEGAIPLPVVIAFMAVTALYILVLVTILPVSVHFEGGFTKVLKHTFQFIFGRPHVALLFGILVWSGIYLSLSFPAVILFFSGSIIAYMLMWFFNRSLEKLEEKQMQLRELTTKG